MRIVTGVPGLCGGPSVGSLASLCRMLALRRRDPCKNDLQEGRASLNPSQPAAVGLARTRNVTSPPPPPRVNSHDRRGIQGMPVWR
jgi:hypothetical protein